MAFPNIPASPPLYENRIWSHFGSAQLQLDLYSFYFTSFVNAVTTLERIDNRAMAEIEFGYCIAQWSKEV
jgi:hypothetical protein